MSKNFNSRSGGVWVQPSGPNSQTYFLGCHDLDPIAIPRSGGRTPVRKFNPNGKGWLTVGNNESPPDVISTTLTGLLFKQRDWLERLDCPFSLYIMMRDCGAANVFSNYTRGYALVNCTPQTMTLENLAMREEEAESTVALEINADNPEVQINDLVIDRLAASGVLASNGVWANKDGTCYGDCGDTVNPGDLAYWGLDSAVGPATADLFYTINGGATRQATTVDPLGAGVHIFAVTSFMVGKSTRRILVSGAVAAGQGRVAWSDDNGATWTTATIGGAAAAEAAVKGSGLFALDQYNVFLATNAGNIHKSVDGGETWAIVENTLTGALQYNAIHFSDEYFGIASSENDLIAVTRDGGATWTLTTALGAGTDIDACFRIDSNRIWVGTDLGRLWYSRNNGLTWTERTGQGFGAAGFVDIEFANELIGFAINNVAGPISTIYKTVDGGFSWLPLTTPTNSGLNDLAVADENVVYVVGEANGGSAVVLKINTTD